MTRKQEQQAEQQQARDTLRALLPVGSSVTTVLRHASRSGMSRSISLMISDAGQVRDITHLAALATGDKIDHTHGGIKIGGCGMDMGFALVYGLSRALYPDGHKCTGRDGGGVRSSVRQRCPSNDHSNDYGTFARRWNAEHPDGGDESDRQDYIRTRLAQSFRKSRKHSDGGYAIGQRWSS